MAAPHKKRVQLSEPINPGFWEQDHKKVAVDLLGRVMQVGQLFSTILDAEGYAREQNSGLYAPVVSMEPGSVYCPRRHNTMLFLLVTHDRGERGGCVLVREVEIDGILYKGPGKVTASLGIDQHGMVGNTTWINEEMFRVVMNAELHPSVKPKSGRRAKIAADTNNIGKATLQRFMVQIVRTYVRRNPGVSFHEFLNTILETYTSPDDLRKFLRQA